MIYDFDRVIDRKGSGSIKWDWAPNLYGSGDVLPMWVADMDFESPAPVLEALNKRLSHGILGYGSAGDSLKTAVVRRMKKKFGWEIDPDWILFSPGVVPSMYLAVRAFSDPGDGVLIQSPVYPPFFDVAREQERIPVVNELITDNGSDYRVDADSFRRGAEECRVFLLCSPHNPVGKVWTRQELTAMCGDVVSAGGVIVSDEIHHELVFPGSGHIPSAALDEEIARRTVTCIAPSKTFNIAGLAASAVIIPDKSLRRSFKAAYDHGTPWPNVLGLAAFEAAYRYGDEWLDQVLVYLDGNREYVYRRVMEIPGIRTAKPQGTFLSWLDCRDLSMEDAELKRFFNEEARVGLNPGVSFGPGGEGYMRLNFACPRSLLEEGLNRIERAVSRL